MDELRRISLAVVVCAVWTGCTFGSRDKAADTGLANDDEKAALARFLSEHSRVAVRRHGDRITHLYGSPMARGKSAKEAAAIFKIRHAAMFGVEPENLRRDAASYRVSGIESELVDQGVMGRYGGREDFKFTLVTFAQYQQDIPVFRSALKMLVRNDADYPLVHVASSLRKIRDHALENRDATVSPDIVNARLANAAIEKTDSSRGHRKSKQVGERQPLKRFSEPELTIWAGTGEIQAEPTLAVVYVGDNGSGSHVKAPERWLFVADATSGEILYKENLVYFVDVQGSVMGMVSDGPSASECEAEAVTPLPSCEVRIIGGDDALSNAEGDFTIANPGSTPVTVESGISGQWFEVFHFDADAVDSMGATEILNTVVSPPGPAEFVHNEINDDPLVLAQVNAYVHTNEVRDWVLNQNPDYPVIANEAGFPIWVNRNDESYCPGNAWYDSGFGTLNFCMGNLWYANTAFASVNHHEYGHRVIAATGSGQGEYGEGMSDVIAMLISDEPELGIGYFAGNCTANLRSAENNCQLSDDCSTCGTAPHDCGRVLSGSVWSVRNALLVSEPSSYLSMLSQLAVNAILLRAIGDTSIDSSIVVDFLTLDDDDDTLANGTPHRTEICNGFEAHGFSCPELMSGLIVESSEGRVFQGAAGGPFISENATYTVLNLADDPIDYAISSEQNWIDITNSTGTLQPGESRTVSVSMGSQAETLEEGIYTGRISFLNVTSGEGNTYRSISLTVGDGDGQRDVIFSWDMSTDPGWETQGAWAYGEPVGNEGDPSAGYTGSAVYGYNLAGAYTNELLETHLTSTPINLSGVTDVTLSFWRWLGVEDYVFDHASIWVSNDAENWSAVWHHNEPTLREAEWTYHTIDISSFADNQETVYLRWTMGATDNTVVYSGWNLDDIAIWGRRPGCQVDRDCDDGNPCTDDICDGEAGCHYPPNNAPCDDGLFCNGNDTCEGGLCAVHENAPCDQDDGLFCNGVEGCDEEMDRCLAPEEPCADDGLWCNGEEGCNETTDTCLVPIAPCQANDGLWCNGVEGCDETQDTCLSPVAPCDGDDGLWCNGVEQCNEQIDQCQSSGNPCGVSELCDEGQDLCAPLCTGCDIEGECIDNGILNPDNACKVCDVARTDVDWSDADGIPCDDQNPCTDNDTCNLGHCVGVIVDDWSPCGIESEEICFNGACVPIPDTDTDAETDTDNGVVTDTGTEAVDRPTGSEASGSSVDSDTETSYLDTDASTYGDTDTRQMQDTQTVMPSDDALLDSGTAIDASLSSDTTTWDEATSGSGARDEDAGEPELDASVNADSETSVSTESVTFEDGGAVWTIPTDLDFIFDAGTDSGTPMDKTPKKKSSCGCHTVGAKSSNKTCLLSMLFRVLF